MEKVCGKKVKLQTNCEINKVSRVNDIFRIETNYGVFICENLIVASGGVSYPKIGATDLGYKIAGQFGHKIINPHPALVGLVAPAVIRSFFSELAGISVSVIITVDKKKICGDLLFTHLGISGPAVLNASLYWQSGQKLYIDFLNGHSFEKLAEQQSKKSVSQILSTVLPAKFAKRLVV